MITFQESPQSLLSVINFFQVTGGNLNFRYVKRVSSKSNDYRHKIVVEVQF